MIKTLYLIVFLFPLAVFSQVTIKGRVISQVDTKPVDNVSVFISNATIGDKTAADGTFTLAHVKPGKYELVVSMVGFDAYKQTLVVTGANISLPDITIYPKAIALNEVKVKVNHDPDRQRNYDWFKDEFLGKSDLAKECRIINPEMLDLSYDEKTGILTASSADFLVIENKALGYRIKYLVSDFVLNNYDEKDKTFSYAGSVLFEPLKGSPDEEQQWKARRQEVYEGSQMHFLRSAINNRIDQDGFRVLRLAITRNPLRPADSVINENIRVFTLLKNDKGKYNYKDSLSYWLKKAKLPAILQSKLIATPLNKADIIKRTNQPGLFALSINGGNDALFISYNKYGYFSTGAISHLADANNTSSTLVTFNSPIALFDNNGTVINPRSLTYDGVWIRNRVAGLLPVDYEPAINKTEGIDSNLVNNIDTKVKKYQAYHNTEKAYLHFDKPYYAAGDTIYFKAYVTNGSQHQLSQLSGLLYADLIDPKNNIGQSIKLQLNNGMARGDFALADTLKTGNYRIRAYTSYMRNKGGDAFFDQTIPIGSTQNQQVPESGNSQPPHTKAKPVMSFLPEGGSLITGVRCKVAFKAIDQTGLGIGVKGVLLDNNNKELVEFAATHLGMGYFYMNPEAGKTYKARLSYANGTQDIMELPKIEENGINLSVTDISRSYSIKISSSKLYYEQNRNKVFTLMLYAGGIPLSISCKLDKPEVTLNINKRQLHTGVAKATLFSAAGEPLCERLLFVQNDDLLKLNVSSDKAVYNKREKVKISLDALSTADSLYSGHFSVAVIDEGKVSVDENKESTIINNLLLTSELKGYIEQPNYYFTHTTDKTTADLDLIMLTNGYRSFEWKKILDNNNINNPMDYQPEKGLQVAGNVKANNKPVQAGTVKLFTKSAGSLMLDTVTDSNGRFIFNNLTFNDSTKFVIQARTAKGIKDVDVIPDQAMALPVAGNKTMYDELSNNNALNAYVQSSKQFYEEQQKYGINKHNLMLKEVVVKEKKKKEEIVAHSANLNGSGNADQVITAKDLENLPCAKIIDCLAAKISGVTIHSGNVYVNRLKGMRMESVNILPDPMMVYIDGTPIAPTTHPLDEIRPDEIEGIEILIGTHYGAIYGSQAASGAIIITTKRGRKINNFYREAPGVIVYKAKGFYKAREFYAPKYEHAPLNNDYKDLRTTIYWNPEIVTHPNGKAVFEYYNADGTGNYRLIIEGMDDKGNLGRQVYRYKVE
ncbi:carboxypeptidase-like regulatory domain-containing protein [Mucilaginibacter sp.]|uniref:carboxypeptidase-like regulatory domain-containing protein n=1 Tax=Mucilaginibacter sp. TaxID=1882438 RepID=UPI003D119E49